MLAKRMPLQDSHLPPKPSTFGDRLSELVDWTARRKKIKPKEIELLLGTHLGFGPTSLRFSKWYKGETNPKLIDICKLLQEVERITNRKVDVEYLMLGRDKTVTPTDDLIQEFNTTTDRISLRIDMISDYLREHQTGIEGLLMRQSILFLEDLRKLHVPAAPQLPDTRSSNTQEQAPFIAGYLSDKFAEMVERSSTHTRLASLTLDHEIEPPANSEKNADAKPGRFFYTVAQNLNEGKKYTFLLPRTPISWMPTINQFVQQLEELGQVSMYNMNNISFWQTEHPLGAGFIVMDIDIQRLHSIQDFLASEIEKDYLSKTNMNAKSPKKNPKDIRKLGMLISASIKTHGVTMMDINRAIDAQRAWDLYFEKGAKRLWGSASSSQV